MPLSGRMVTTVFPRASGRRAARMAPNSAAPEEGPQQRPSCSASIYGLVLMFLCLQLRVFRLEDVRDTALFLIEIMPLMFIPAATGLMTSWGIIRAKLFAYLAIAVITTVLVMVVSGRVTQFFLRRGRGKEV